MNGQATLTKDEKTLAGLAHGSILLGLVSGGIGGIVAALVIWLTQKEKSAYAGAQALQALVYQAITLIVTTLVWCCWGLLWVLLIVVPVTSQPYAYESAPPPGIWVGMALMVFPLAVWALTILYGLYGAARCFGGHDFKYAIIGNWLKGQ
jgi:uncharacterized Tic20 family protein